MTEDEVQQLNTYKDEFDNNSVDSIFKRDIENFIVKGKSQSQSWEIDLTVGGRTKAQEILESALSKEELNTIKYSHQPNVQIKFKLLEWWNSK